MLGALVPTPLFAQAPPPAPGPNGLRLGANAAVLEPVAFADLAGWMGDDHAAALDALRRTCAAPRPAPTADTPAADPAQDLTAACAEALRPAAVTDPRAFFEGAFEPYRVLRLDGFRARPRGFLTAYYEPELEAVLAPDDAHPVPLLARPDDLVDVVPGTEPGLDPGARAARRGAAGLEPYPDAAAIADGALGGRARPLAWLRDRVDLLLVQVQGSGRLRLPDGRTLRVGYDGRNGRPYTSVARVIVAAGHLPLEGLTLARWTGWLRAHPAEGEAILRANASYIFFRVLDPAEAGPGEGPIGAAGAPLIPERGLAVDAGWWRYGLPVWLEIAASGDAGPGGSPSDAPRPARRLVIAADTGGAITGPIRGDLFLGSGAEAGARAALVRHPARFVVLLPRRAPAAPAPTPDRDR